MDGGNAIPVDSSTEPAAQPCGGMWVGDPKSWPEWKAVHQQTALVKTVADQAEVAFGDILCIAGMILVMRSTTSLRSVPG